MGSLPKELRVEDFHLDVRSSSSSGNEDGGEEEEEEEEEEVRRRKKKCRSRGNSSSSHLLQNKRRRSGFQSHLSLGDLVGDQKKFWASLQHTHDWSRRLNDQKDNELEWDYGDVQTPLNLNSSIWTFNDFMERYNQLYASLNQIQDLVFSSTATSPANTSSADSQILNEALATHLEGIREEYEIFVKRSSLMAEEFTDLWDEVMCRVELLAAKWEILMARSSASKASVEEANPDNFHSDIEQDVRGLRKWLKEMEGKILPLRFRTKWSREAIEEKMKEIQVILSDIESHGRIVKSVLRLCEDLKKGEGELSPRSHSGLNQNKASYYDVDRAYRIAKGLEDRWHGVWLRSLEWHYFLEKLAWNSSEGFESSSFEKDSKEIKHCSAPASLLGLISSNSGFDSEDEPRCKVPKLTGLQDLSSSPSSTLLRTKRRKTSEYARINHQDHQKDQSEENESSEKLSTTQEDKKKDEELGQEGGDQHEKSLEKTWNRVLEAAAALEENHCKSQEQRKTLKVNRKKGPVTPSNMNGDIVLDDNRSGSPNNNSVAKIIPLSHSIKVDNEILPVHSNKNISEKNSDEGGICKMATSESEQSLNSVSSGNNNNNNNDDDGTASNHHLINRRQSGAKSNSSVTLATRKTIPNCATYFIQHVSEDEHVNSENGGHKSSNGFSPRRSIKRDPYDRSSLEDDESDEHYLLSDSASTSDFLGSNAWLKELEEDDRSCTDFSDSNAMESSTNTIVESTSSTFLNDDIQELVHQAEKLVQNDQEKVKKRTPLANANSNSRRRRSRKSLLLHPASTLDGCEASAEATSTSESDFSDDDDHDLVDDDDDEGCSSPGEMDTSLSSHDQTLTGSCSTNALDVVSINTSTMTLGSGAMSKLKKYRRRSSVLSASESHLVCSFKKSVSLNNSQKSRSVASIYGSPGGSFGGVVKKRKGSVSKKFAIPCMSTSSEEEMSMDASVTRRRKSLEEGVITAENCSEMEQRKKEGDEAKLQHEAKSGVHDDNDVKKTTNLKMTESPRSIESEEDFWDQENYLSEHNYDEAIDEDTAYRVLNFGDDYSVYINSMSDGISSNHQPPKQQRRKTRRNPQWREDRKDSMSESEVEDVKRVLNTSKEKYEDTEAQFNIYLETQPEDVLLEDYFNLKKTCQENMSCLALLMEPIFNESDSATLKKKGRELKGLLQKWDGLIRSIIRRIELTKVLHELEDGIQRLEGGLKDYLELSNSDEKICSSNDLRERIAGYKDSIGSLKDYKDDLLEVNIGVHNFLAEFVTTTKTESGVSPISPLKKKNINNEEEVAETKREWTEDRLAERLKERLRRLYSQWEEVFHLMNTKVVECETTLLKLTELEEESKKLLYSNKQIHRSHPLPPYHHLNNEEDEDSGISGSSTETEIAQKERLVQRLRLLARELEQTLSPESRLLQEISQNLETTSHELKHLSPIRRNRLCGSNEELNHQQEFFLLEEEEDDHRVVDVDDSDEEDKEEAESQLRSKRPSAPNGRKWRSRVLRSAVPMQIGLFLMWFLSWAMEPTCCDSSNTFFLAPQLRYVNGPPPI